MYKIGLVVVQLLCCVVGVILGIILALSTICCLIIQTIAAGWNASDELFIAMQRIMKRRLK